ncbi:MAG: tRNA (adenosine(37)-N6)-threonylcarbamoyltransferase complex dimerization subunit type 1 TsaB [Bacteroidia bacterium]
MALILNIETATETCSVALAKDGKVLAYRESSEPKAHAAHLTLFIEEVIKNAGINYNDLDAIAVSKGPGSYTGLRIGVSTAKGLCFALDKPLLSVNTLQAFSDYFISDYLNKSGNDIHHDVLFCPMIDARRMEVYTAVFDEHLNFIEPTQAIILNEHSFNGLLQSNRMVFFGTGATKLQQIVLTSINAVFVSGCENSAKGMVRWSEELYKSGDFEDLAYFEPFYLKDFITTQSKQKI